MNPNEENTQENVNPLVNNNPEPQNVENTDPAPDADLQASADDADAANTELQESEQSEPTEPANVPPAPPVAPVVPEPENPSQPTANTGIVEKPDGNDAVKYEKKAHRMKKVLQEQPQVKFMVPLGIGERQGAYETVQINGYKLTIMKGVMVDLPQQVVDILSAKYQITMEAGNEFKVDADPARADALS